MTPFARSLGVWQGAKKDGVWAALTPPQLCLSGQQPLETPLAGDTCTCCSCALDLLISLVGMLRETQLCLRAETILSKLPSVPITADGNYLVAATWGKPAALHKGPKMDISFLQMTVSKVGNMGSSTSQKRLSLDPLESVLDTKWALGKK